MPPPVAPYLRALRDARARGYALGGQALDNLRGQFRSAAAELGALSFSGDALAAARAQDMRVEVMSLLVDLDKQAAHIIGTSAALTTQQVAAIHERAILATYDAAGVAANTAAITARFSRVAMRAMISLNARRGGSLTFETLTRRHLRDAAPAVDQLIGSSIARGVSADKLTNDLASLMLGESIEHIQADYGLLDVDVGGLRSLYSDARRIAVTETNNALREGNRISMIEGGIVEAASWQLSGRHEGLKSSPDECDDLAEADDFGLGPGMYPPEEWPEAPHPYCGCTQGGPISFRDPSEWPDTESSDSPIDEDGGEVVAAATPASEETITQFRQADGTWEPDRQQLHDDIKQELLGGLTPVENPTVRMLGGGPASGKSVMLKDIPGNWAHIDADEIKSMLPEWDVGVEAGDKTISAVVHEESSYLARQIANEAINSNFNVIMDGTGDNSYENLAAKVESYRRSGNRLTAEYVTVDTETAIARANARGEKSGRFVPESVISEIHRNVSIVVPQAIDNGLFDEFTLWDNNGSSAVKIAEAVGRDLTILDEAAWLRFLSKVD